MACTYTVRQGDCLSSIAAAFHLSSWRRIYDHPQNAGFKTLRLNPNVIYPGDELYIPGLDEHVEPRATDRRHKFVRKSQPTYLNVCIRDSSKQPIAGAKYKLVLENGLEIEDFTGADGWIRREIPARAQLGTLLLWPNPQDGEAVLTWRVKLGHLDPMETTSGIKGRLGNLGYYAGDVDDRQSEEYFAAVRQFQEDHGLKVDGIVGPITRGKLTAEHKV